MILWVLKTNAAPLRHMFTALTAGLKLMYMFSRMDCCPWLHSRAYQGFAFPGRWYFTTFFFFILLFIRRYAESSLITPRCSMTALRNERGKARCQHVSDNTTLPGLLLIPRQKSKQKSVTKRFLPSPWNLRCMKSSPFHPPPLALTAHCLQRKEEAGV